MARDAVIEARLQRWAEWRAVGDGSGYPSVCVLHENWSPPSPGQRPMMKVAAHNDAPQTDRALRRLPAKWLDLALVHYVKKGALEWQGEQLGCMPDTVLDRVERLHRLLAREFCDIRSSV